MGQIERSAAQARPIAFAPRAGFRDMADRIRTGVAVLRRIGRAPDADRVENENESAGHRFPLDVSCSRA